MKNISKKQNAGQFQVGQKPWNAGKKLSLEYRSILSKARLASKYCRGEGHSCWNGGSRSYYKKVARNTLQSTGQEKKCFICGTINKVGVHHKDRNWKNNTIENLAYLCSSCHLKLHHREDRNKNICGWCEKTFISGRKTKKCCSASCNWKLWHANKLLSKALPGS